VGGGGDKNFETENFHPRQKSLSHSILFFRKNVHSRHNFF
jgi:hypothetical protein